MSTAPSPFRSPGPTRTGQLLGTPLYMAPEQAQGGLADVRSDVYGLGATLYYLLTGRPPHEGGSVIEVVSVLASETPPTPPSRLRPEVDRQLETVVLEALAKRPERRYPSARAMAADLGRYLRHEPVQARPPSVADRLGAWARRHRGAVRVGAAASALLLAAGLGAVGWVARAEAEARRGARVAVVSEARRDAAEAWAAVAPLGSGEVVEGGADLRTARALRALQRAQRWRDLAPGDPDAAAAQHRAALQLGHVALGSGQWALASEAYAQAVGLGVDDAAARAARERVAVERRREAARREREVAGYLAAASRGELGERPGGLVDAVFAIARYRDPVTVAQLADCLNGVTAALEEAEARLLRGADGAEPPPDLRAALAARAAAPPGAALPAEHARVLAAARRRCVEAARERAGDGGAVAPPSYRRLAAAAQREAVGAGSLAAARLACDALGRIGVREGAVAPLGRHLFAERDENRALRAAEALCRLGGSRARALVDRARARFGVNSTFGRRAERALAASRGGGEDELALEGDGADAYLDRGIALLGRGRLEAAAADFEAAIARAPKDHRGRSNLGDARRRAGRLEEAVRALERAAELAGDRPGISVSLGYLALERRRLDEAAAHFAAALARDPEAADAWHGRAAVGLQRGDLEAALRDVDRAIALEPDWPALYSLRAAIHRRAGRFERALADLERVLRADPDAVDARINRGNVYLSTGDPVAAIAEYDDALERDPRAALALESRAFARLLLGQARQALRDAERATALDPRLQRAWRFRGRARLQLGDPAGAVADLDRALELDPTAGLSWARRAEARAAAGDLAGADADYAEALRRDPQRAVIWRGRAALRERRGDLQGALADYDAALRRARGSVEVLTAAASVSRRLGRPAEALDYLERALALDPTHGSAALERGRALAALDRPAEARRGLEAFVAAHPDDPAAGPIRALLEGLAAGR